MIRLARQPRRLCLAVLFLIGALWLIFPTLTAFGGPKDNTDPLDKHPKKISPVLSKDVRKTADAEKNKAKKDKKKIPLIVRYQSGFFNPNSGRALSSIRSYASSMDADDIKTLLDLDYIEYVTYDAELQVTSSDVQLVTLGVGKLKQTDPTLDGTGITVAVFDSGINPHPDIANSRIKASMDFTPGQATDTKSTRTKGRGPYDEYGHGTHVAGIIGGTGLSSNGAYAGVAGNVDFVDVKVIGPSGGGMTSDLISAIEWVILNKDTYNIRVANLSLGHAPVESYVDDPLCQAVESMVHAGIVTVCSSGNMGKSNNIPKIWGNISSPGNDPTVITVYPINTRGTATHTDDIATSYGSRGPTYIDNLFKPDLCAPGNGIVSLLASGSDIHKKYPKLQVDSYHVKMSGSSMAAPYVTGAVALMLQAKPTLNPSLVKLILNFTATKLTSPYMMEQGNGLLNTYTAVDFAKAVNRTNRRLSYTPAPKWALSAKEDVWAGGAYAYGKNTVYSPMTNPNVMRYWGNGIYWGDGIFWSDGIFWADAVFHTNGVFWSDSIFWADALLQTRTAWSNGIFWTDGVFWGDGIFWGDGVFWGDGIFWADAITIRADTIFWADSCLEGDF
jgi:serine protease AprX